MNQSSRIVFFGNEKLSSGYTPNGAPTLRALLDNGYSVVAIVANYHQAVSRSKHKLEVQEFAEQNNIPIFLPEKPIDIIDDLKLLKPDIGVLVAYGKIIPQEIIDIFPRGIVNIHPSMLPLLRGSTPIEQAILDGADSTGVTLMQIVKAMDAGPIFSQQEIKLRGTETKPEITQKLHQLGNKLLVKNLPSILDGSLKPKPQDDSKATFCKQLSKTDSILSNSKTANQLEKQVRAQLNWPKSRLEIFGQIIIVTEARVASALSNGDLVIDCKDNTFLEVKRLIAPSGRSMTGADFLRGYKK